MADGAVKRYYRKKNKVSPEDAMAMWRARKRVGWKPYSTRGFNFFCLYIKITVAVVCVPLLLMYAVIAMKPNSQRYTVLKSVSRQSWKYGERVRRGLLHRFMTPVMRNAVVFLHSSLLNVLFFSLVSFAVLRCMGRSDSFSQAVLWALIPTAILLVFLAMFQYASWYTQYEKPIPTRYKVRTAWRTLEKTFDKIDDSAINLCERDQIRDAMSMSSLARMDKLMLFGMPTALIALGCYVYDLRHGDEAVAKEIREASQESVSATSWRKRVGLFRA